MKRIVYLLMVLGLAFSLFACDKLVERGLKKQMDDQSQTGVDMLTDGNLHVVLVGTGGPFPNTERVSVATAVIAGGEFIMVDTGPGTVRNALLQQLPMGSLSAVFLTHFHSDHIADLGEANMYSWVQGNRNKRLEVFGPPGVEKVVEGYALAYEQDSLYRTAHHGEPEVEQVRHRCHRPPDQRARASAHRDVSFRGRRAGDRGDFSVELSHE